MDAIIKILTNRRGWVPIVAAISAVAAVFGLEIPQDALMGFGDKVVEVVMSGLALWSLFMPKE